MASPAPDTYACASGGSIHAGRVVQGNPMLWSAIPTIRFTSGVAKSVPMHEYLPDGGDAGQIIMSYSGGLPSGVTFNSQTSCFVYSGSGSGSGAGMMTAKTIPCFVTISFTPTAATYPQADQSGNPVQVGYPFSFTHMFKDGQVLPGTSVYCLSVKNGLFGDYNDVNEKPETFRCDPIDYYASGCMKNATLCGLLFAVWKSDGVITSNTFDLIAIAEPVTYGAVPAAPLGGTLKVIYEASDTALSSTSAQFSVQVT